MLSYGVSAKPVYALPGTMIGGYTSLYIAIREYSNVLVGEVSTQSYGGIIRVIALGTTDGISTWRSEATLMYQPVVVLTGPLSLGRIYNVIGSVVDPFLDRTPSVGYQSSVTTKYLKIEGNSDTSEMIQQVNAYDRDSNMIDHFDEWATGDNQSCIAQIYIRKYNSDCTSTLGIYDSNHLAATYLYFFALA